MKCPECGNKISITLDSRKSNVTRRRRECVKCKFRFTTYELYEETLKFLEERYEDKLKILKGLKL